MAERTEHYGLTIWGREDEFKAPEGLNGNFGAVEEALAALAGSAVRVVYGSYQGTGGYGYANPVRLEIGFPVQLVLVANGSSAGIAAGILVRPGQFFAVRDNSAYATWDDTGVSWLHQDYASTQYNSSGTKYNWVAIG